MNPNPPPPPPLQHLMKCEIKTEDKHDEKNYKIYIKKCRAKKIKQKC